MKSAFFAICLFATAGPALAEDVRCQTTLGLLRCQASDGREFWAEEAKGPPTDAVATRLPDSTPDAQTVPRNCFEAYEIYSRRIAATNPRAKPEVLAYAVAAQMENVGCRMPTPPLQ